MTTVVWIAVTVVCFLVAQRLYVRFPKWYLSPIVVVPLALIVCLTLTRTSVAVYDRGGSLLSDMLQPATVAFAVPLYKHYALLRKHAVAILTGVVLGSSVAVLSSFSIMALLHASPQMIASMVPRSITTPIAMSVSQTIGGIPSVTAVFVIVTGIGGSVVAPLLIRALHIRGSVAKGVLLGMGAHGAGTSLAYEWGSEEGAIASISMIVAAIVTLAVIPLWQAVA
ncbi:LrgB family protein [Paenibacillus ginsengarvi]|uniref:LrgB family protein n=1 Tax=Paenibacillus ginsengarvi TaxID=400777 RepID=A0A3B0BGU6_9BACL|nr:LrgB family protein [Paenibacillus ginsengarvi]RKN71207.1 LrgB family protein [Paenibacillus ginsengarvi]